MENRNAFLQIFASRKLLNTYFIQVLLTVGCAWAFVVMREDSSRLAILSTWVMGLVGALSGYNFPNAIQKMRTDDTSSPSLGPDKSSDTTVDVKLPIASTPTMPAANILRIVMRRVFHTDDYTEGHLEYGAHGEYACATLEDEPREVKVAGETRIPAGVYKIGWNRALTDLTVRYRRIFDWFKWHIEIKNVPNFVAIYFHPGNTDRDTAGCVLLGQKNSPGTIKNSRVEYEKFYKWVERMQDAGYELELEIIDEAN